MADVPLPSWGDRDAVRAGWRERGLVGLAAYEDAAVRRVLARLKLRPIDAEVVLRARETTGVGVRTFAMMETCVGGFPVQLRCGTMSYLKRLAVPDVFDRFTRTPIYTQLAALIDGGQLDPDVGPVGMVFKWATETVVAGRDGRTRTAGIRGGKFMAIHTYPTVGGNTRIVHETAALGGLTIETLDGLLDALGGWAESLPGYA